MLSRKNWEAILAENDATPRTGPVSARPPSCPAAVDEMVTAWRATDTVDRIIAGELLVPHTLQAGL